MREIQPTARGKAAALAWETICEELRERVGEDCEAHIEAVQVVLDDAFIRELEVVTDSTEVREVDVLKHLSTEVLWEHTNDALERSWVASEQKDHPALREE